MLHQAMPDVEPSLAREIERAMKFGYAWVPLRESWLFSAGIAMTNVLAMRPEGNNLETLCASKAEVGGKDYDLPALVRGKYLRPEYLSELSRLQEEISTVNPNLIVALGNTACWATLHATNIGSIRGAVTESVAGDGRGGSNNGRRKVLATYHPAGVLRQWSWRTIVIADLIKAWREAQFPELRRPARTVLINPTLAEIRLWLLSCRTQEPLLLSIDIETKSGQITCIGFARSRTEALVVPFVDLRQPSGSYWPSASAERLAWGYVAELLALPVPKVFQNGVYDLQYLMRMGLTVRNCAEDTMLLHHSLFPEMQKGLGFLGSIYTSEASWKLMRRAKTKEEGEKRDE